VFPVISARDWLTTDDQFNLVVTFFK